jgi:hypothetical protein
LLEVTTPLSGFLSVLAEEENGSRPSPQTLVRKVSQPPFSSCIAIIIENSTLNNTANFLADSEICCMEVQAGWGAGWKRTFTHNEEENLIRDRMRRDPDPHKSATILVRRAFFRRKCLAMLRRSDSALRTEPAH